MGRACRALCAVALVSLAGLAGCRSDDDSKTSGAGTTQRPAKGFSAQANRSVYSCTDNAPPYCDKDGSVTLTVDEDDITGLRVICARPAPAPAVQRFFKIAPGQDTGIGGDGRFAIFGTWYETPKQGVVTGGFIGGKRSDDAKSMIISLRSDSDPPCLGVGSHDQVLKRTYPTP